VYHTERRTVTWRLTEPRPVGKAEFEAALAKVISRWRGAFQRLAE
jgi:hypothetical protein